MAQLIERSLPIPEVRGLNAVIGKNLFTVNCIQNTKIKKKEAGNGPLKSTLIYTHEQCDQIWRFIRLWASF